MDLTDREKRCADCVDFMKRAITAMDDANEAAFQKSDSCVRSASESRKPWPADRLGVGAYKWRSIMDHVPRVEWRLVAGAK